jgi:hypothetical protein
MGAEQEDVNQAVDTSLDVVLRHTPQSGVHGQSFTSCHLFNQGVKLGAVTHVGLHLFGKKELWYIGNLISSFFFNLFIFFFTQHKSTTHLRSTL